MLLFMTSSLTVATVLLGCMPSSSLIVHKRDEIFYQRFVNPVQDEARAADKIGDLKILLTGSEFPIRAALFESGKFFYQVDKLGDGYGNWSFKDGGLELRARRPIFDMELVVSAAQETGDAMVIQFLDRFGLQLHNLSFREPVKILQKGKVPSALPLFSRSSKEI